MKLIYSLRIIQVYFDWIKVINIPTQNLIFQRKKHKFLIFISMKEVETHINHSLQT